MEEIILKGKKNGMAVLVLTIAFLILFDLQRIMRGKIRVMSGIDATVPVTSRRA